MELKNLQQLLFKTITQNSDRESSQELVIPSENLTAQQRIGIYQNNYRHTLQDTVLDDFEVSTEILGEPLFDQLFKKFVSTHFSEVTSLNAFGEKWLHFIYEQEIDPSLKELSTFEWRMSESFFSHVIDQPKFPQFTISENPPIAIRLDDSVYLIESQWPLDEIYKARRTLEKNQSFIIHWTQESKINYRSISANEFFLIQKFQECRNIDDVFNNLVPLGMKDEQLAQFLQSSIANFMKYGFLIKV